MGHLITSMVQSTSRRNRIESSRQKQGGRRCSQGKAQEHKAVLVLALVCRPGRVHLCSI